MRKLLTAILIVCIASIFLMSGCAEKQAKAVCGDSLLSEGEECDGGGCAPGESCVDCRCIASQAAGPPSPPPLPP